MASTSVVFDIIAHDRASSKFNTLGKAADGSTKKMSKFNGMMKTAGKAAAYGLGAGLLLAVGASVKFVEAAIEDEKAAANLAGQLKRNADATDEQVGEVEKWISAMGRAKGVADDDLRPALARLVTATGDVSEAQDLASLAMDVSAGSGKSLESVSTALMKATNGNVSALSRLGINTKNAAGETITMEQATKRMADQFGGAATEKANTLSGKIDRLKLMFSEAGESLGTKLLPYVERFANYLLDTVVPNVEKFVRQMENGRGEGGKFADKMVDLKEKLKTVSKFVLKHKEDIGKLVAAYVVAKRATQVWTGVTLILNATLAATPFGRVIAGAALLTGGFVLAYNKSERFRDATDKLRGAFIRLTGKWVSGTFTIKSIVMPVIQGATNLFGDMRDMIGFVIGKVQSLIDWLGKIKVPSIDLPGWVKPRPIAGGGTAPGFESFAAGGSIFGTDLSVEEGGAPRTVADILAAGQTAQLEAQAVAADTAKLISMGLSDTLLRQLQEAGVAGAEQIHLLASGTAAEIATANAQQAATQAALMAAGVAVGTELAAGPFGPGGPTVPSLADLTAKGGDTYNITVNGSLNGSQAARQIVRAIKTYKRVDNGGRELGIA